MGTGIRTLTDRDQFIEAVRRVVARDRNGFADPDDVATELGIGLFEVTKLVRRYPGVGFRSDRKTQAALMRSFGSSRPSIRAVIGSTEVKAVKLADPILGAPHNVEPAFDPVVLARHPEPEMGGTPDPE
jgi:hypothetical protein